MKSGPAYDSLELLAHENLGEAFVQLFMLPELLVKVAKLCIELLEVYR